MRIAMFSDVHGNYHALEAVLSDMAARGVDVLVCLGDLTLKGPLPKECVDRIRDLHCPVVLGNTDGAYSPDYHPHRFAARNESQRAVQADFERNWAALTAEDRTWLTGLPLVYSANWEGARVDCFHAAPDHNYVLTMPWATNEQLARLFPDESTNVAAFAHSHRAFIRHLQGRLAINSGSVGVPFDGDPRPSYALLDLEEGSSSAAIVRVPYDAEAAIRAARDVGMAGWELFAHTARTGQFPG